MTGVSRKHDRIPETHGSRPSLLLPHPYSQSNPVVTVDPSVSQSFVHTVSRPNLSRVSVGSAPEWCVSGPMGEGRNRWACPVGRIVASRCQNHRHNQHYQQAMQTMLSTKDSSVSPTSSQWLELQRGVDQVVRFLHPQSPASKPAARVSPHELRRALRRIDRLLTRTLEQVSLMASVSTVPHHPHRHGAAYAYAPHVVRLVTSLHSHDQTSVLTTRGSDLQGLYTSIGTTSAQLLIMVPEERDHEEDNAGAVDEGNEAYHVSSHDLTLLLDALLRTVATSAYTEDSVLLATSPCGWLVDLVNHVWLAEETVPAVADDTQWHRWLELMLPLALRSWPTANDPSWEAVVGIQPDGHNPHSESAATEAAFQWRVLTGLVLEQVVWSHHTPHVPGTRIGVHHIQRHVQLAVEYALDVLDSLGVWLDAGTAVTSNHARDRQQAAVVVRDGLRHVTYATNLLRTWEAYEPGTEWPERTVSNKTLTWGPLVQTMATSLAQSLSPGLVGGYANTDDPTLRELEELETWIVQHLLRLTSFALEGVRDHGHVLEEEVCLLVFLRSLSRPALLLSSDLWTTLTSRVDDAEVRRVLQTTLLVLQSSTSLTEPFAAATSTHNTMAVETTSSAGHGLQHQLWQLLQNDNNYSAAGATPKAVSDPWDTLFLRYHTDDPVV